MKVKRLKHQQLINNQYSQHKKSLIRSVAYQLTCFYMLEILVFTKLNCLITLPVILVIDYLSTILVIKYVCWETQVSLQYKFLIFMVRGNRSPMLHKKLFRKISKNSVWITSDEVLLLEISRLLDFIRTTINHRCVLWSLINCWEYLRPIASIKW